MSSQKTAVLTMDGGGPQNLLTTILLKRIEQARPGFLQRIDVVAGTSSGSLTALMLGTTEDRVWAIDESISALKDQNSTVGKHAIAHALAGLSGQCSFMGNTAAKDFISRLFGTLRMRDLHLKTVVPALQLDNRAEDPEQRHWGPAIFHNLDMHGPDATFPSTNDLLVVDAYLRTTALPILLPVYQGYIDGGYVADNPSMATLTLLAEAHRRNHPRVKRAKAMEDVMLLSVGTGATPLYMATEKQSEQWGYCKWLFDPSNPFAAITAVFTASQYFADYQSRAVLDDDSYFRLNPPLTINPATPSLPEGETEGLASQIDTSVTICTPPRPVRPRTPHQHETFIEHLEEIAYQVDLQPVLDWLTRSGWSADPQKEA